MLDRILPEQLLVLDIETVPQHSSIEELDERSRGLWERKSRSLLRDEEAPDPEELYRRAALFAEFGKVVCVSLGIFHQGEDGDRRLRITSYSGDDEVKLLKDLSELLDKIFEKEERYLCAHNGKGFDFPYLARRMLVQGVQIPAPLRVAGKKPWEVPHIDTMEYWAFGDRRHSVSLDLLTHIFGIPTPKDDIDGSEVGRVYWEEGAIERIVRYCEKDVKSLAQVLLCLRGEKPLEESAIDIVD